MTLFDAPAPPEQPAAGPGAGPGEESPALGGYLSKRTTGADGKPIPQWWMPAIGPPPKRRDMSRKALEHLRAKRVEKAGQKRYKSARQMAEEIDEANDKENEL